MSILLTGGLGYIGSHLAVSLLEQNHEVVILDNLSRSDISVFDNIQSLVPHNTSITLYTGSIDNTQLLETITTNHKITHVIHLAGYKSVSESIKYPELYFDNNVNKSVVLLEYLVKNGINNFIFSSSATVYAPSDELLDETSKTEPVSTYGLTKLMFENVLRTQSKNNPLFNATILRYFNPIGEHPSGLLKDTGKDNLYPAIKTALENNTAINVYGNDYPTPDGTCIRDFINIQELVDTHILFLTENNCGCEIYNVGTGKGRSVLDIIAEFPTLEYKIKPRRNGDAPSLVCSNNKIARRIAVKCNIK